MIVKTNSQLIKEEQAAAKQQTDAEDKAKGNITQDILKFSLINHLRTKWDIARKAKITKIEPQMFKNIRQAKSEYERQKLAAIKEMGGSEIFVGITDTKCRNAIAWIKDIEFQPSAKPWGVGPTPVPDLPQDMISEITQNFVHTTMQKVIGVMGESDQPIDMQSVLGAIQDQIPGIKAEVEKLKRNKAEEKAAEIERIIDDKLTEGGWYEALDAAIFDIVVVKNGFLKGPINRYRSKHKVVLDSETNKKKVVVGRELVGEYERRSPFDIYPEPDSSGIQDGYLFDHVSYRRKDLQALIDVDGFDSKEIRAVLKEYVQGGSREWTGIEVERAETEDKDTMAVYNSDKIDALEYYGSIPGSILKDFGITGLDDDVIDYECVVVFIDKHIIKAVINDDQLGKKPYSTAGYDEQPGSFWFKALPERITGEQGGCNLCGRATLNNIAMGSGPQVEINIDRLLGGSKGDTRIIPWRKWLTTNKAMQQGNAINFWQAQMHAQEIMNVFKDFSKLIDERSGVPAYAHGDPQVGGAGNTASGLSMLITQAARAIKAVIKNIDTHMIIPSIQKQYDEIIEDDKYIDVIGDIKLVARGSTALIEKEQRAMRMLELLNATNNPVDTQITGMDGRAYMLGEIAKTHEIDPDKVLAGMQGKLRGTPIAVQPKPGEPIAGATPGGTPPNPAQLDQAGNPVSGTDNQMITGQGGHVEKFAK